MDKNILEMIQKGDYNSAYDEANTLFDNGDHDGAYVIYDEIYEDVCEKQGRNSIEAYDKLLSLGNLCYEMDRYDEALRHYTAIITFVQENNFSLDTHIKIMSKIAYIHTIYGNYEKAKGVLNDLLKHSLDNYGEDSGQVVNTLNSFAETLYESGDLKEALEYFKQVHELAGKVKGCTYGQIFSLQSIGRIYYDMKQEDKASDAYENAYKMAVDEYGEEDTNSLSILNDISNVYHSSGELDKAYELKKKLLEIQIRVFGENDHNTQMARLNLGSLYADLGKYEKALELKKAACEWFERNLGESHKSTIFALNALKNSYMCNKEDEKSFEICERLCNICERTRGKYHIDTLRAYTNLAVSYRCLKNITAAFDCAQLAYDRACKHYGDDSIETAELSCTLASLYGTLGENKKAVELCEKYLATADALGMQDLYSLEYVNSILASSYVELGEYDKAKNAAQDCLDASFRNAGRKITPYYLMDMDDMAMVYADTGEGQKALEMIETVLEERKKNNITYPDNFSARDTYAHVLITLGSYADAETVLNQTITDCPDKPVLYYRMAELYKAKGIPETALEYAQKALEIAKKNHDSGSGIYRDIIEIIEKIKENM